jgi:hypothetical protein
MQEESMERTKKMVAELEATATATTTASHGPQHHHP